jgi:N6-L-threonylcarbamoyladenine synthase
MSTVVGIDTSCDDTGVGIVRSGRVIANVVASQDAVHAPFGGVVPERASRAHVDVIDGVMERALHQAGIAIDAIDAVAATYGPGLAGALLVGLQYGKGLAYGLGVPFVKVHHLEGHVAAAVPAAGLTPPYLVLIASGGHTILFDVTQVGAYEVIGRSLDDAAGEAFDKVARLLGLPFPGGAALARLAEGGDPSRVALPVPLAGRLGFDLSFSGLKTAVATLLERNPHASAADVAAAFQERAVGHLVRVALRAATALGRRDLVIAGGVAANAHLRRELAASGVRLHAPPADLTTDNGAMIALAAAKRLAQHGADPLDFACDAAPYLPLGEGVGRPREAR